MSTELKARLLSWRVLIMLRFSVVVGVMMVGVMVGAAMVNVVRTPMRIVKNFIFYFIFC